MDALSARWAADPHPTAGAALADGLRKTGDLRGAELVLERATDRFPGHLPLWLTVARVAMERSDPAAAHAALARALAIDPSHPMAREMAAEAAPTLLAAPPDTSEGPLYFTDPDEGEVEPTRDAATAPELVTESLAALYHRQGHLALALAAYSELAARDPGNATVAARHESVRNELAASRPLPFDARESGGQSTARWLAQLAAVVPDRRRPAEYDAFYDPPPAPPEAAADFGAFQRWLEELDK